MSDPFILWLMVDHWLATTICFPLFAFFYAIFTGQPLWAWCAGMWAVVAVVLWR